MTKTKIQGLVELTGAEARDVNGGSAGTEATCRGNITEGVVLGALGIGMLVGAIPGMLVGSLAAAVLTGVGPGKWAISRFCRGR